MSKQTSQVSVRLGNGSIEIDDRDAIYTPDGPAISTTRVEDGAGYMVKKTAININKFEGTITIDNSNVEYDHRGKDAPKLQHRMVEDGAGYMVKKTFINLDAV